MTAPARKPDAADEPVEDGSDYDGLSPALCRAADERQRNKPADPRLRLRRLMGDDVTLERAHAELSKPEGVAASTLQAAEYLMAEGDPDRLRRWLDKHGATERTAILQHLAKRKGTRAA